MSNDNDAARGQEIANALTTRKPYVPKETIGVTDISSIETETGIVTGLSTRNGEQIRVRLSPNCHENSPTPADFVGLTKAPLLRVDLGGSIRADGATLGSDGVYEANFFAIGNPSQTSGRMYEAHVRVNGTYSANDRMSKSVDVVTESAIAPKTKADLISTLAEQAAAGKGVLVRTLINGVPRVRSINVRYDQGEPSFSGSEAFEKLHKELIDELPADIELHHVGVIEVLPYQRLYVPTKTLASMVKTGKLTRYDQQFLDTSDPERPSSKGFVRAVVTEAHFGDDGVGIKDFATTSSRETFSRFGPDPENRFQIAYAQQQSDRASRELGAPSTPSTKAKAPAM